MSVRTSNVLLTGSLLCVILQMQLANWLTRTDQEGRVGDEHLRITYANKNVEKHFKDYREMQKKLPFDWVRKIKKHIEHLSAAETFGDFLKVGLGHPEPLKGNDAGKYSVRVTGNVRLIIQPKGESVIICEVVEIEGVVDYHGDQETWYIR